MNLTNINEQVEQLLQEDDLNSPLPIPNEQLIPLYSGDDQYPVKIYLHHTENLFFVTEELHDEVIVRTYKYQTPEEAMDEYISLCSAEEDNDDIMMDLIQNGAPNFLDNIYADYLYRNLADAYFSSF